jgi:hypothetical protein
MPLSHGGVVHLDPSLEAGLKAFLRPEDLSEPLLNLVRGALAAHEQAFHFPDVSKEAFLAFIAEAWDSGADQLKISRCEVEGGFMNEYGLACSFASSVALFGATKGILPKDTSGVA